MNRAVRRFRTLPIRSRLALLVAAAVAFGVAAVSVTCWFIVQGKLYDEIDTNLKAQKGPVSYGSVKRAGYNCGRDPKSSDESLHGRSEYYTQVVKADGTVCAFDGSAGTVKVTSSDMAMVKNPSWAGGAPRTGTDSEGNPVRVLIMPLIVTDGPVPVPTPVDNTAVVVAAPWRAPSPP
uniref:Uncharacterized protein n=1 Tax=Streptomyces avermitilis TaxID=33903 RepID=A0A499VCI5_STRAX|nr:hypothetical protein SAVMC3_46430 [Streptomyces avermitilis]